MKFIPAIMVCILLIILGDNYGGIALSIAALIFLGSLIINVNNF